MIINGLCIPHPATFQRREREAPRVVAHPSNMRVRKTIVTPPSNPKAIYMMPIVAVALAIGSMVAGAAGAAALVGGAITVSTVLAGAMFVGGAATLIGVATGNKNLVKYGGILSAVGGIGTLAMGMLGGGSAPLPTDAASPSVPTGTGAESIPTGETGGATAASTGTESLAVQPPAATSPQVPQNAIIGDAALPPAAPSTNPAITPNAAAPDATGSSTNTFQTNSTNAFDPNAGMLDNQMNPMNPSTNTLAVPTGTGSAKGFFNNVGQWVKDNSEFAKIGERAVTGLAGSLVTSPTQAAQINLNDAQADYARTATARAAQKADWGRGISKPLNYYLGN